MLTAQALTLEAHPAQAEAGLPVILRISAPSSARHGVAELKAVVCDGNGVRISEVLLVSKNGEDRLTGEFSFTAPKTIGEHRFNAVLEGCGSVQTGALSAEAAIFVAPQSTAVSIWGAPAVVPAGENFEFIVGMKSTGGSCLANRPFDVVGQNGEILAREALGQEVWPNTEALYWARVRLAAPNEPCQLVWRVDVPAIDMEVPLAASASACSARITQRPGCEVVVEVRNVGEDRPLSGISVLMHPYHAVTDKMGKARLKMVEGKYQLHISGARYFPYREVVDVCADMRILYVLFDEPVLDEYEFEY